MAMAKRVRSPNYPFIDLEEALQRARALYENEKTHPTGTQVASRHWGYKSANTGGGLIIAALRAYGLLDTRGSRDQRKVWITDSGRKLILDQRSVDHPKKIKALQEAALKPKIHAELWERWGGELPSDESIWHYLVMDRGFNESKANRFIEEYKNTLTFARLTGNGRLSEQEVGEEEVDGEGIETGAVPKSLVEGLDRLSMPKPGKRPGMNQDTLTLDEGQVVLQWPAVISPENYEDLRDWMELMSRRIKRAVRDEEESEGD